MTNNIRSIVKLSLSNVLITCTILGQSFWGYTFETVVSDKIISTGSGNFLIAYQDAYHPGVMKISMDGEILWSYTFDDISMRETLLISITDGNEYLFVYEKSDENGPQSWNSDILARFSSDGQLLATQEISHQYSGGLFLHGEQLNDTSIVFTTSEDLYLYNSMGNLIWDREVDNSRGLTISPAGKILVLTNDKVLMFSDMGTPLDTINYAFANDDVFNKMIKSYDDGIAFAGVRYNADTHNFDLCLLNTDFAHNVLWERTLVIGQYGRLSSIAITGNENILLGCHKTQNDSIISQIIKYSTDGNVLWNTSFAHFNKQFPISLLTQDSTYFVLLDWENTDSNAETYTRGTYFMNMDESGSYLYPVSVDPVRPISPNIKLSSYPNPFNSNVTFKYDIPLSAQVQFRIYSVLGETVYDLNSTQLSRMGGQIAWNPKLLASGVYIVSLQSSEDIVTRKIILLK